MEWSAFSYIQLPIEYFPIKEWRLSVLATAVLTIPSYELCLIPCYFLSSSLHDLLEVLQTYDENFNFFVLLLQLSISIFVLNPRFVNIEI